MLRALAVSTYSTATEITNALSILSRLFSGRYYRTPENLVAKCSFVLQSSFDAYCDSSSLRITRFGSRALRGLPSVSIMISGIYVSGIYGFVDC